MFAIGSLLAGAGVVAAGLLALLFRHPRAPRWTRPELVVMLMVVPVSTIIGLGLGAMLIGGYALARGQGDLRELAVPVAVAVVLAVLWYASGIKKRLRVYALATAGEAARVVPLIDVTLATDRPPESPAPSPPPRRPTRKAA